MGSHSHSITQSDLFILSFYPKEEEGCNTDRAVHMSPNHPATDTIKEVLHVIKICHIEEEDEIKWSQVRGTELNIASVIKADEQEQVNRLGCHWVAHSLIGEKVKGNNIAPESAYRKRWWKWLAPNPVLPGPAHSSQQPRSRTLSCKSHQWRAAPDSLLQTAQTPLVKRLLIGQLNFIPESTPYYPEPPSTDYSLYGSEHAQVAWKDETRPAPATTQSTKKKFTEVAEKTRVKYQIEGDRSKLTIVDDLTISIENAVVLIISSSSELIAF